MPRNKSSDGFQSSGKRPRDSIAEDAGEKARKKARRESSLQDVNGSHSTTAPQNNPQTASEISNAASNKMNRKGKKDDVGEEEQPSGLQADQPSVDKVKSKKQRKRSKKNAAGGDAEALEVKGRKDDIKSGSSRALKRLRKKQEERGEVIAVAQRLLPLAKPEDVDDSAELSKREHKRQRQQKALEQQQLLDQQLNGGLAEANTADGTEELTKRERKRLKRKARMEAVGEDDDEEAEALGNDTLDAEIAMLDADEIAQRAQAEWDALNKKDSRWSLSPPSGGRFIDHDPIFAIDPATGEQVLIAATNHEIHILSIETSLPLRTFAVPGDRPVRSYAVEAASPEVVHAVCHGGAAYFWRWTLDTSSPHTSAASGPVIAVVSTTPRDERPSMWYVQRAGTETLIGSDQPKYKTKQRLLDLQVLGAGDYIVGLAPYAIVAGYCRDLAATEREYVWVEVNISIAATCMDARLGFVKAEGKNKKEKARLSVAIGNVEGHIHLHDDLTSLFTNVKVQQPSTLASPRILHWHRKPVSALKFSRDGNYIISGGQETVLVLWQLATGKKQYLPHLTSEIRRIVVSPKGDRYALGLGDNSLMVLSTSELRPVANFAGMQLTAPERTDKGVEDRKVAACLNPGKPEQLLLAVPATIPRGHSEAEDARAFLQTFDLKHDRHISRQALTRNNVTDLNVSPEGKAIAAPDIKLIAVCADGQWLASVDEWIPAATDVANLAVHGSDVELGKQMAKRREVYLKFWTWDEDQKLWALSTRVDAPHSRLPAGSQGAGKTLALAADPASGKTFATVGEDGVVKLWRAKIRVRRSVAGKAGQNIEDTEWSCRQTVELPSEAAIDRKSPRGDGTVTTGLASACLAWSADGSVLAVSQTPSARSKATGPTVYLIDAHNGSLKSTINLATVSAAGKQSVHALAFADRYMLAATKKSMYTWDLVTDTLHQSFDLPPSSKMPQITVNLAEGTYAISTGAKLAVRKVTAGEPLWQGQLEGRVAAIFAEGKGFVVIGEDATIQRLSAIESTGARRPLPIATAEDAAAVADDVPVQADVDMTDVLALPPTESMPATKLSQNNTEDDRPVVRPEELAKIFDVAQSFAMPSVKEMFSEVVDLFSRKPRSVRMDA